VEARSPLEMEIRRRIALAGPMPVAEYMTLCLFDPAHGYYTTHDPFGARGDFITAPEVSQMFGELIGLWVAAVWKQIGAPENVRLIELGPGRGTMIKDALRAVKVVPEFRAAAVAHLVEVSPLLRAQQEKTLEDAGVTIAAGTDAGNIGTIHGPALFREFQLMKEAGLTTQQILQSATSNAAQLFGGETGAHIGRIEKGYFADLVVLNSDPADDIARASDIQSVIKNGVLYSTNNLLTAPAP